MSLLGLRNCVPRAWAGVRAAWLPVGALRQRQRHLALPAASWRRAAGGRLGRRANSFSTAQEQRDDNLAHAVGAPQPPASQASVPGAWFGDKKMMMRFTCTKCNTTQVKVFTRGAYENGVVLIRCEGCQKLHLIADNLGWFGEQPQNIEQILAERGESVSKIQIDEPAPSDVEKRD